MNVMKRTLCISLTLFAVACGGDDSPIGATLTVGDVVDVQSYREPILAAPV